MAKWYMEKRETTKPIFHSRQMMLHIDDLHRVVMTNEINSEECHEVKVGLHVLLSNAYARGGGNPLNFWYVCVLYEPPPLLFCFLI